MRQETIRALEVRKNSVMAERRKSQMQTLGANNEYGVVTNVSVQKKFKFLCEHLNAFQFFGILANGQQQSWSTDANSSNIECRPNKCKRCIRREWWTKLTNLWCQRRCRPN